MNAHDQEKFEAQVAAETAARRLEIVDALKEGIGEFLFRRSRVHLSEDHNLSALGISQSDISGVIDIVREDLVAANNGEPFDLIVDDGIQTLGDLANTLDKQLTGPF